MHNIRGREECIFCVLRVHVDCGAVLCVLQFLRGSVVEIVSVDKPLRAMAMPFLTAGGNRVVYINHRTSSVSMQMVLVVV